MDRPCTSRRDFKAGIVGSVANAIDWRESERSFPLVGSAGVLAAILPVEEEVGDIGTVNAAIEVEVCGAAGSVLDP